MSRTALDTLDRPALLVIDVQHAFLTAPGWPARLERIAGVAEVFRSQGLPVIFTQEIHRAGGFDFGRELDGAEDVHCLEGEPDTALAIEPRPGDHLVVKRRYSCFHATDLEVLLRSLDVRSLVLSGALTDVCVHCTFADAHQRDFVTRVVVDCVGGSSTEAHEAALAAMAYLQRDAHWSANDLLAPEGVPA